VGHAHQPDPSEKTDPQLGPPICRFLPPRDPRHVWRKKPVFEIPTFTKSPAKFTSSLGRPQDPTPPESGRRELSLNHSPVRKDARGPPARPRREPRWGATSARTPARLGGVDSCGRKKFCSRGSQNFFARFARGRCDAMQASHTPGASTSTLPRNVDVPTSKIFFLLKQKTFLLQQKKFLRL